ncbi:MAG: OmpH family outer membrane protein [Candidatus Omnitrophota bacterium]
MNKISVFIGILLAGLLLFVDASYAAEKFAYVDLAKIFSGYGKAKDYEKSLTDKQNNYEIERNKMVNEVKQLQEKMNLLADNKEKEAKKTELENKLRNFQELDRQKQIELRKEQDEKTKEILKDISETVKEYAEKEGYTMVFNNSALVYQDKSFDITDRIIDLLGKKPNNSKN